MNQVNQKPLFVDAATICKAGSKGGLTQKRKLNSNELDLCYFYFKMSQKGTGKSTPIAPKTDPPAAAESNDDDWETDPDYVNNITEKEQRTGIKTLSDRNVPETVSNPSDMKQILAKVVEKNDATVKEQYGSGFSKGYGGKYGKEGTHPK